MPFEAKCRKSDLLAYIAEWGMIEPWQLRDHFDISEGMVAKNLSVLKRQGLVMNMTRGRWELTNEGYRRLHYYEQREGKGKI